MTTLKIGDDAPYFEAKDNAGNTIKFYITPVKN